MTITTKEANIDSPLYYNTTLAPVANVVTLEDIVSDNPFNYASVQLYDVNGDRVDVGTAGTFVIEVYSQVSGRWEYIQGQASTSTIQATAPETLSWSAPTWQVRVTPSGVTGAVSYRVFLKQYRR